MHSDRPPGLRLSRAFACMTRRWLEPVQLEDVVDRHRAAEYRANVRAGSQPALRATEARSVDGGPVYPMAHAGAMRDAYRRSASSASSGAVGSTP